MSVHSTGVGSWRVKWRENGKQKSRHFDSRNSAELYDLAIKEAKRLGAPLPRLPRDLAGNQTNAQSALPLGPITLHEYMTLPLGKTPSFYERRQAKLAPANRRQESTYWDKHIEPFFREVSLGEIDVAMLEDFRDTLLDEGVGPSSVERCQKIVGKVLNDAVKRGHIPHNPAQAVNLAKRTKQPVRPLDPSEIDKIAEQLDGRHRLAVLILGKSGPRPGELFGLGNSPGIRWEDLHTNDSGRMSMRVFAGKTGTYRLVWITPKLQTEIEQWRAEQQPDPDDLLVPSRAGGRWHEWEYRNWRKRVWSVACDKAGVGVHRPYSLRHGFASALLHEGRGLPEVAGQLGHSVQVCASTYAHVLEGMRQESSSDVP